MPLDQPGLLLSLRLVRIPRLRSDNDAHHFLSSRQDSPIQADAAAPGRPSRGGNGFGITREEVRGLYRHSQTWRGQPSVHVDGNVKLTKFLQKPVPHQPWLDESQRGFNTYLLVRKAIVECWRIAFKAWHVGSFQCWAGALPNSQSPM
jgi:hypothetical protein